MFNRFLYNFSTKGYFAAIKGMAVFHKKARLWVHGRKGVFEKLERDFVFQKNAPQKVVWFHCASLGEFEQGRTVLEALKKEQPACKILITFFSPSGYEMKKGYPMADWVHYLPEDSKENAHRFLLTVRPTIAVFVKYEFWYHYLTQLHAQQIPVFLIAASFRKGQPFFKWYGGLHRQMLGCFETIFVQHKQSISLLNSIGIKNAMLAGDPRIDRVLEIAGEKRHFPEIAKFCGGRPVLVAGSTWAKDEELLFFLVNSPLFSGWKMIIAPHDVSPKRIGAILTLFGNRAIPHSKLGAVASEGDVLLVDSIGKLAWLYQYGQLAYIGGGFGQGIHNTLEPMASHLPVLYGPRYSKFVEAVEMINEGGHFCIRSKSGLLQVFETLSKAPILSQAQNAVKDYISTNKGATQTIIKRISGYL